MKKYLLMMAALFVGAVCFTSCGDDDPTDDIDDIENGTTKPVVTLDTDGNPMTLTIVYKGLYTMKAIATFDSEDNCTSYIRVIEYTSEKMAQEAWKSMQSDTEDMSNYTLSGKTITIDETDMYKGDTRETIKSYFEMMAAAYQRN